MIKKKVRFEEKKDAHVEAGDQVFGASEGETNEVQNEESDSEEEVQNEDESYESEVDDIFEPTADLSKDIAEFLEQ